MNFREFANAVNHAVHWLIANLPVSDDLFQSFAYAGPKDLLYLILAVAAEKFRKVVSVMQAMYDCNFFQLPKML